MTLLANPVFTFLTILSVLPQGLSLPAPAGDAAIPAELCADNATIKNLWTVESLKVTYAADLTKGSGRSTFKLTNTRTNFSEEFSCALRANYVCEYQGTPADPGLNIWMQLHIETAYVTINQSWSCGGGSSAYAVGMAEVTLTCPDDFYDKGLACTGADEEGSANGVVTVFSLSPSSVHRRGLAGRQPAKMAHKIESSGTVEPKSAIPRSSTHQKPREVGVHNLDFADELRRKTWQALGSVTRRRNSNSKSRREDEAVEIRVGPYPLPRSQEEEKNKKLKLKKMIKDQVDIEHLCSPACRGDGPRPASGDDAGVKLRQQRSFDDVFGVGVSNGHGIRGRPVSGRGTNPVRPNIVLVDV